MDPLAHTPYPAVGCGLKDLVLRISGPLTPRVLMGMMSALQTFGKG